MNEAKRQYKMDDYDVVVVGAGHAGCEAGLAAARMGKKTLILSMQLEAVAMLACNPSIGGTGKGHLVREIDALGGEMGINIDKTFLQSKMLNRAKGPAVHSLRAQADKSRYHEEMKRTIEMQEGLDLKQGEVIDIIVDENAVKGVILRTGAVYYAKAVVIATGTFLRGTVFIGESAYDSGPNGLAPATKLAESLKEYGLSLRRFKTGTPGRVLFQTLDTSKMEEQKGDDEITPFSFMNEKLSKDQVSCWLTYTTPETHDIVRSNIKMSSLYGGLIEGIGPRYCPSIEDKITRFSDKERHQLFLEPEGANTDEMYIQGMSTSLPEDIQEKFYRSIPGLENAKLARPAYAIEYDSVDSQTLMPSLEHKEIQDLFCAGQFNGSSGYEEAAAQGLVAGINAALKIDGRPPLILDRSDAYIGVLIDDLVTKGTDEPYRIMTSRAEYRLILRQDNADLRLTEKGYEVGLVTEERYNRFLTLKDETEKEVRRLETTYLSPDESEELLRENESAPASGRLSLADLLRRPEISYEKLDKVDASRPKISYLAQTKAEVQIKYEGYIKKQLQQIEKFKKLEGKRLPVDMDYQQLEGLRIEARQKLNNAKPLSVGQASRIPGVTPADINVLLIYLEKRKRQRKDA